MKANVQTCLAESPPLSVLLQLLIPKASLPNTSLACKACDKENPPDWKIYQPLAIRDDFLCNTECVHKSVPVFKKTK